MQIYELIIIFLVGTALGIIARYILGYRKKSIPYVALNVLLGGVACAICHIIWGSDAYAIFLSGVGGVIFNCAYCVVKLLF